MKRFCLAVLLLLASLEAQQGKITLQQPTPKEEATQFMREVVRGLHAGQRDDRYPEWMKARLGQFMNQIRMGTLTFDVKENVSSNGEIFDIGLFAGMGRVMVISRPLLSKFLRQQS